MIEYHKIRKSEIELAVQFCKDNGFEFPLPYEVAFGAFDECGKLIAICVLKKMYQIEPLINTVKMGHISAVLAEKVMACASLVTDEVVALSTDIESTDMFKRYGFKVRDENVTSIYKEL